MGLQTRVNDNEATNREVTRKRPLIVDRGIILSPAIQPFCSIKILGTDIIFISFIMGIFDISSLPLFS